MNKVNRMTSEELLNDQNVHKAVKQSLYDVRSRKYLGYFNKTGLTTLGH